MQSSLLVLIKEKFFLCILSLVSTQVSFFFNYYKENTTWACTEKKFLFKCSTQYLSSEGIN